MREPEILGRHFLVRAWVGPGGQVLEARTEGWQTFPQIWSQWNAMASAPSGVAPYTSFGANPFHRFVVFERKRIFQSGVVLGCWEHSTVMRWVRNDKHQFTLRPPEPLWTADTVDALVMKAIALYDREISDGS